jgi:5-methylcytosine-specific restriction endonuclease McrA
MKTYFEKLKDPRWQRKRLEVMERAGFACEYCGSATETLNVHHGFYEKGKEPWEYDNDKI